jgi:hypothetical protein
MIMNINSLTSNSNHLHYYCSSSNNTSANSNNNNNNSSSSSSSGTPKTPRRLDIRRFNGNDNNSIINNSNSKSTNTNSSSNITTAAIPIQSPNKCFIKTIHQTPMKTRPNNNNNKFKSIQSPRRINKNHIQDDSYFNSQQEGQEYYFESNLNNSSSLSSISSLDHIHSSTIGVSNDKRNNNTPITQESNSLNQNENQIHIQNIVQMYEQIKRDTYSFPKSKITSNTTTTAINPSPSSNFHRSTNHSQTLGQRQRSRSQSRSIISSSYSPNTTTTANSSRSRSLSSKRGERRKGGKSKINDAEIENVILKQILASSLLNPNHHHNSTSASPLNTKINHHHQQQQQHHHPFHYNLSSSSSSSSPYYLSNINILKHNSSFSDDISVATSTNAGGGGGSASVISTFTTRDILGDLTDQEDHNHIIKSVVSSSGVGVNGSSGSLVGGSVSGGIKGSRRQSLSCSSSSSYHNNNDATGNRISPQLVMNDVSNRFYNNHHQNFGGSKERVGRSKSVVSRRIRLKDGSSTTRGGRGGAGDEANGTVLGEESLQLYDSFMKNLSIDSSSQHHVSNHNSDRCSPINSTMKKIGSDKQYHHDNETSTTITTWNPFEHSFEIENNQDHNNNKKMMTKPSLTRLSSAPVKLSSDSDSTTKKNFKNSTLHDFDLFSSYTSSPTLKSKLSTFSSSKSDFQPSSSSFRSSTLTDRNSLVKAVYSFTEANAITKKSRPKQFMEDRKVTTLSPVRMKKSSSPIARNTGNNTSGSSSSHDWTAFSSDNDVKVGTSDDNVTNHSNHNFASWASFTDHNNKTSSSLPKSKINSSWETNQSPFSYDKVEESNNEGFKIVEHSSSKQMDHYSNDLFKDFGKDCSDDMTSWDGFDESSLDKSDDPFGCDVSKLSTSTISFRGSPKVLKHGTPTSSGNGSSKLDKATAPSTVLSSNKSFQHHSSESLFSSSKVKTTPTLLKGSPRDTVSQMSSWTNESPSGVADFNHNPRKSLFFQ